ncbi:MAG TPA: hypothetical protein PKH77_19425, partial [Anaerolineae bacterium]|nr:hypothetical protein [Anaerolineae bacterium]
MPYDPTCHHRHSIRLRGYDYASAGMYFVTVCVQAHRCVLGEIVGETMALSSLGRIVDEFWAAVPHHFPTVTIDTRITMPNHIHAIIIIDDGGGAETAPIMASHAPADDRRGAVSAPIMMTTPPDMGTTSNVGGAA